MNPQPPTAIDSSPDPHHVHSAMPRSAVVLVCDRLNPAFLGPYGNTWIETEFMNRLAAESLLVEQCLTHSLDLEHIYAAYWSGRQEGTAGSASSTSSFIDELAERNVATTLLTDESRLIKHPLASGFARHVQLPATVATQPAQEVDDTLWAAMISAALTEMTSEESAAETAMSAKGRLLWIHARGCEGSWDAPYATRESFAAEDDPAPPDFLSPPHQRSLAGDQDRDPDELLGLQQAYAAEISVLDECLLPLAEMFHGTLSGATDALSNTLFILTSPRGFPLGEHGVVGDAQPVLHSESLQVPLLIRFPDGQHAAERATQIWQPADLCDLLQRWMSGATIHAAEFGSERATAQSAECWSLRTPAWFVTGKEDAMGSSTETQLYVKPDDRYETNNVADICHEIAQALRSEFDRTVEAEKKGQFSGLPTLPDELRIPQA